MALDVNSILHVNEGIPSMVKAMHACVKGDMCIHKFFFVDIIADCPVERVAHDKYGCRCSSFVTHGPRHNNWRCLCLGRWVRVALSWLMAMSLEVRLPSCSPQLPETVLLLPP
jgi:hypothetical protein